MLEATDIQGLKTERYAVGAQSVQQRGSIEQRLSLNWQEETRTPRVLRKRSAGRWYRTFPGPGVRSITCSTRVEASSSRRRSVVVPKPHFLIRTLFACTRAGSNTSRSAGSTR